MSTRSSALLSSAADGITVLTSRTHHWHIPSSRDQKQQSSSPARSRIHISHMDQFWSVYKTSILHVYFSKVWQLSSIIYSLLFLFYILFIVSTQIAASRRKHLKSDVWTLWLDIAIWSLSQKENSIIVLNRYIYKHV
jgi:hypothetical protein